jgi:peptidyl-prolyl cis-trans isomerase SurA
MKYLVCFALLIGLAGWGRAESVTVEGIAGYVNDSVITVGEVKELIAPLIPELRETYQGDELRDRLQEAYDNALQDLIATKLIVKAYEADTKINKEAVEKHVEKRESDFIQERFGGDRPAFIKTLKDEHMSLDEWRKRMRERVVVGLMRNREVDVQSVVSPREVRQVYDSNPAKYSRPERVKLRVILIHGSTNETDRAVRFKQAQDTVAKLKAGEDFADQARRVSEDGKAQTGGDWGWMEPADLRKELAGGLAGSAAGAICGPLVADGDFYILKVEERQKAGAIPFDDVCVAIEKDLRRKETRRLFELWISRLKKDAYIQVVKTAGP